VADIEPYQFEYFSIDIYTNENILFSSTTLTEGNVQLYITKGDTIPSLSEYQWKSSFYRNDEVLIETECDCSTNGTYNIGVFSYVQSKFQL
jgi:hypothetical protein